MRRRDLIWLAGLAAPGIGMSLRALAADKVVRIGVQKYGSLILLKERGLLEERLAPQGWQVAWTEFPGGPQLLEALNVGAIDFGTTGEAPPIFAQAAGAPLALCRPRAAGAARRGDPGAQGFADEPASPSSRAGRWRSTRARTSTTCWCGRSSTAGLAYGDIEPVYLPPADARAAFERGAVDAWAIWDPFLAAAQAATGARTLADGTGLVSNHQFYLAAQPFLPTSRPIVQAILADWSRPTIGRAANPAEAAVLSGRSMGIPAPVLQVALERMGYGVQPLDDAVVAEQQKIADTFYGLGLLPKPIKVARCRLEGQRHERMPPRTDVLWFLPTHGDGRYLGTTQGAREVDLALSAPDRPGCRRSRLFRRAAADRALAARIPGSWPRRWRR